MLKRLSVQDFQSLREIAIAFPRRPSGGALVTVVGPSSTGKSAVVRALRLLFENSAHPAVRAGASATKVEAELDSGISVGVIRGKALSTYYTLTDKDDLQEYPKAGKTVPDEIQKIFSSLRTDLHFAGQFDKPYLLDVPASAVSRAVGDFTNANVLQAAAREGTRVHRLRKAFTETRLTDMKGAAEAYTELRGRLEALTEKRTSITDPYEGLLRASQRLSEVRGYVETGNGLEALLSAVEASQEAVPDVSEEFAALEALCERFSHLHGITTSLAADQASLTRVEQELLAVQAQADEAATAYRKALEEAGYCPMCMQEVHAA